MNKIYLATESIAKQAAEFKPSQEQLDAFAAMVQTEPSYAITNGVAVINYIGFSQKYADVFSMVNGGVVTTDIIQLIKQAEADTAVSSLLFLIDSGGGTYDGTGELAEAIRTCSKPTKAQISDNCHSAALWMASQCDEIVANEQAYIGSIGTVMVIPDTSKAYEAMGIKIHVLSSGTFKGEGFDGSTITKEQLGDFQRQIEEMTTQFVNAVAIGRGLKIEDVKTIADGRSFTAADALKLGLIDKVESYLKNAALQKTEPAIADMPADMPSENVIEDIKHMAEQIAQVVQATQAVQATAQVEVQASIDTKKVLEALEIAPIAPAEALETPAQTPQADQAIAEPVVEAVAAVVETPAQEVVAEVVEAQAIETEQDKELKQLKEENEDLKKQIAILQADKVQIEKKSLDEVMAARGSEIQRMQALKTVCGNRFDFAVKAFIDGKEIATAKNELENEKKESEFSLGAKPIAIVAMSQCVAEDYGNQWDSDKSLQRSNPTRAAYVRMMELKNK